MESHFSNVQVIYFNSTIGRLYQSKQSNCQRTFASTCPSNNSNFFPSFDLLLLDLTARPVTTRSELLTDPNTWGFLENVLGTAGAWYTLPTGMVNHCSLQRHVRIQAWLLNWAKDNERKLPYWQGRWQAVLSSAALKSAQTQISQLRI